MRSRMSYRDAEGSQDGAALCELDFMRSSSSTDPGDSRMQSDQFVIQMPFAGPSRLVLRATILGAVSGIRKKTVAVTLTIAVT
jgi:hypothetical protein